MRKKQVEGVEVTIVEATDMPPEVMGMLSDRDIAPDFYCKLKVYDASGGHFGGYAVHMYDTQEGLCAVLVFVFMFDMLWQMMLETPNSVKIHRAIGRLVHSDLPEVGGLQ